MLSRIFSFDTIKNFDKYIRSSIPNYDLFFDSVLALSDYFKVDNKRVYDLGCSTGKLLRALDYNGEKVGIDLSSHLLQRRALPGEAWLCADLNRGAQILDACVVYALFTFQFLNRNARQRLANQVYSGLIRGGVFFFAEKVYSEDSVLQDMFTSVYFAYKRRSFTEKEILDKEQDLRSILRSNTTKKNMDMLYRAGFKRVFCFYKYFNFEGYLCIK